MACINMNHILKNFLLLINAVYWTCGLFLIYLSFWTMIYQTRGTFLSLVAAAGDDLLRLVSICLMFCGTLVLCVGISGACGTVHHSKGWMTMFLSLVMVLLTIECLGCVMILLYQPSMLLSLKKVIQSRLIHDYGREGYESFTVSIDLLQYSLSCCGIVSPSDYQNSMSQGWRETPLSYQRLEVPLTCCSLLNKGSYQAWLYPQPENWSACQSIAVNLRADNRFTQGCFDEGRKWLLSQNVYLMTGTAVAMILQISSIVLTLCMCRVEPKRSLGQFV